MDIFLFVLRLFLAGTFAVAAFGKIFDRAGSIKAFADFGVPDVLRKPLATALPAVELATAIALLFISSSWIGAIGAAALLSVFLGGMFYQLAQGRAPDCHCFGQIHSEPVGASSIIRNVVLLAMAGFVIGQGSGNQGLALVNSQQDIPMLVIGLVIIGLIGVAIMQLNRILERQNEIVRRIEVMEIVGQGGASVERENVAHPHEGLPIGAMFPDFDLSDINGERVTRSDIMAAELPALFIFISPTCTPCKALVPEFEQWRSDLQDKINLVFVSNGEVKANVDKFGEGVRRQILLQKDRELAEAARAKWTPTAILVDRKGRIASHAAAGDTAIRELVEKISVGDLMKDYSYVTFDNERPVVDYRIGQKVPEFELRTPDGNVIGHDVFSGKTTLVTFWGLDCGHCKNMLEDLRSWDATRTNGDPQMIIFSEGDPERSASLGFSSPVVIDEGHKVATGFGMFGTPSAVLVDENGVIVSETAIGAPDIWALAGRNGAAKAE